jgi:hypothetical protein
MREIEITPELAAEIEARAATYDINPNTLKYYVQFGPSAPRPPSPPSRWTRLRWRIRT